MWIGDKNIKSNSLPKITWCDIFMGKPFFNFFILKWLKFSLGSFKNISVISKGIYAQSMSILWFSFIYYEIVYSNYLEYKLLACRISTIDLMQDESFFLVLFNEIEQITLGLWQLQGYKSVVCKQYYFSNGILNTQFTPLR